MAEVTVSVKSALTQIIGELEQLRDASKGVSESFTDMASDAEKNIRGNTKRTEAFLNNVGRVGLRIADQLRRDFKSLFALNAVTDALKISNQFRNVISQTVELSDTIRRLGPVFGVASNQFVALQTKMTSGLGEIGLSADVGARALEGLSQTQVRGDSNLVGYAQKAGMLASIGGEKGQEGSIAKLMAGVIQARGGNVNDAGTQDRLAESVRKAFNATGMSPTKILSDMASLFEQMPQDMRQAFDDSALANLAAVSAAGGPGSTKFIEEYLKKGEVRRSVMDASGGADIFTAQGLDIEKFRKFLKAISGRIKSDPTLAVETLGVSEEAAKGMILLGENLDKVKEKQDLMAASSGSLNAQFDETRSLMDAFRANLARVSKEMAAPIATFTQTLTEALVRASKSDKSAAGVVAGTAVGAAALAGIGLSGIFGRMKGPLGKILGSGSMLATAAKGTGAEALLGQNTIPVYVVNAGEIGGGVSAGLPGIGGVGGGPKASVMDKIAMATLAGAIGYAVGSVVSDAVTGKTQGVTKEGFHGDSIEQLIFKVAQAFGSEDAKDAAELGLQSAEERRDTSDREKKKPGVSAKEYEGGQIQGGQPRATPKVPTGTSKGNFGAVDADGGSQDVNVKVEIEMKTPLLKATASTTSGRGASIA